MALRTVPISKPSSPPQLSQMPASSSPTPTAKLTPPSSSTTTVPASKTPSASPSIFPYASSTATRATRRPPNTPPRPAASSVTAAHNQVISDVEQAYSGYFNAKVLADRYNGHYLDEAKDVLDISQFSYEHGGLALIDYLDAHCGNRAPLPRTHFKRLLTDVDGDPSTQLRNRNGSGAVDRGLAE